tara:strand:- start:147 stop:371 length:225 start_codon:yes stop_codon:yes gene_type:complete
VIEMVEFRAIFAMYENMLFNFFRAMTTFSLFGWFRLVILNVWFENVNKFVTIEITKREGVTVTIITDPFKIPVC